MTLDRSQHKPAARTPADFEPCHIPARPVSATPGSWTCRCWSCSAWIGHETAPLAAEPWRYHVCQACWESLSVNQRIEMAFRLSAACEGGLGTPQAVTQVVAKLTEVSDQIVATCRGFNVWLTEAMDLWRQSLAQAAMESAGDAGPGSPGPPGGLGEGPAEDSSDIDDADWWRRK